MATRRKPPAPSDLSDLKARLGLGKTLEKKAEQPEPELGPGESTTVMQAPGAFAVDVNQGAGQAAPPAGAPRPMPGGPPMGGPPMGGPPMGGPPMGGPPMGGPPMGGPPQAAPPQAQRPPFAGPPGGPARRAPGPPGGPSASKPRPKAPESKWEPPPLDPTAGADVPIKSHRSAAQLLGFVAVTGIIAFLALGVGYFVGDGVQQRKLYDARIGDAQRLNELVKPRSERIQSLAAAVERSDGLSPDPELLKQMENLDFVLAPEEIAQGRLLLGPERTTLLIKFAADTKHLSQLFKQHTLLTNRTDKKELEELANNSTTAQEANFGIIFNGEGFVKAYQAKGDSAPTEGKMVVFDQQQPFEKDGALHLKVRYPSSGREIEVPIKNMVLLDKAEIVRSSGPNAQVRYQRRHQQIAAKLKEMSQYSDTLVTKLDELAQSEPAPLLNVGK